MFKNKNILIFNFSLFIILFIGLLMNYSSSNMWGEYKYGSKYYYLIRQTIFMIIGILFYFLSSNINYRFYKKYSNILFIGSFILIILVLIPGIGIVRGGARSWINLGLFTIQPSELMKVSLIIFTSKFLSKNEGILKNNKYFYLYIIFLLLTISVIFLQPDFGSAFVILISIILLLFIGEFKLINILIGGSILILGLIFLIIIAPYRLERINAFINPWNDPLGSGFQIIQSLYAIAPASLFGYGLFNSKQKYFFLPEPFNDFIFAIICEELGILGGIIIIILYAIVIQIGYKISVSTNDIFAKFLSFGITSLLMIQVFINIAVVTNLIPTTGINLIFISYGGTSLIVNLFMLGILNNIMKQNKDILEFNYK